MTIGILAFGELSYLPFLNNYTDVLEADGVVYDVVYWNREHLREEPTFRCRRLYRYGKRSPIKRSIPGKFIDFMGYRAYVEGLLRENAYDRLIVLTTLPAVLLAGTLARRYAGRYVFDVRDYAYEHFSWFYDLVEKVVKNAALCVSSSPGFRSWLPQADWKISHNVNGIALRSWLAAEHAPSRSVFRGPVRVLRLVGRTRSREDMKAVIDQLGGDERYEVHYHGDDPTFWNAPEYARRRGATNIHFHGRYRREERWGFYENSDLVMSSFDLRHTAQLTPLNNKLYDSAMALRPIMVSRGTYLAEVVDRYGLGLAVDPRSESIHEAIERYAPTFDASRFADGSRRFLTDVLRDDEEFLAAVRAFARGT